MFEVAVEVLDELFDEVDVFLARVAFFIGAFRNEEGGVIQQIVADTAGVQHAVVVRSGVIQAYLVHHQRDLVGDGFDRGIAGSQLDLQRELVA